MGVQNLGDSLELRLEPIPENSGQSKTLNCPFGIPRSFTFICIIKEELVIRTENEKLASNIYMEKSD